MKCQRLPYARAVADELERETGLFGKFDSPEQGLAILVEEVGDLAQAVLKCNWQGMETEAVQVAAMAHRFLFDICRKGPER